MPLVFDPELKPTIVNGLITLFGAIITSINKTLGWYMFALLVARVHYPLFKEVCRRRDANGMPLVDEQDTMKILVTKGFAFIVLILIIVNKNLGLSAFPFFLMHFCCLCDDLYSRDDDAIDLSWLYKLIPRWASVDKQLLLPGVCMQVFIYDSVLGYFCFAAFAMKCWDDFADGTVIRTLTRTNEAARRNLQRATREARREAARQNE